MPDKPTSSGLNPEVLEATASAIGVPTADMRPQRSAPRMTARTPSYESMPSASRRSPLLFLFAGLALFAISVALGFLSRRVL